MWSDRYVVYYSKEKRYSVRWYDWDGSDERAHFRVFDDRVSAERFYNRQHAKTKSGDLPDRPVEIFFSQAKWVRYHQSHLTNPADHCQLGEVSAHCQRGHHETCSGDFLDFCTCPCHLDSSGSKDVA